MSCVWAPGPAPDRWSAEKDHGNQGRPGDELRREVADVGDEGLSAIRKGYFTSAFRAEALGLGR